MRTVREVIVVEGRYDKNAVAQAVNGTIVETSGFGVFSDKDLLALLRKLAEKCGLIILTDSDKAGFFIRGRLRGILGEQNVKHAYIPDVGGREKRKALPSKEGKLGVEGMSPGVIITALERAGATFEDEPANSHTNERITKTDLYASGLSGGAGSAQKRRELSVSLDLPARLSANGLLDVLNVLYSREEFLNYLSGYPESLPDIKNT
jgi:ribonuclease M5